MVRYAGESVSDIGHDVTSGPGAPWASQTTTYFHDGDAAKSGAVSTYGQSWMQTTVNGPGIIRFYWKVSSQANGDFLEFFLDGVRQDRISGTSDWLDCSYTIATAGTHTLRWRYIKNGYGSSGSDCGWVDYVQSPMPSDWNSITYVYDPGGRRIEKKYDGQAVMKYLYDGDHIIAEYDATGALVHKYIYGPGVDQPICMIDASDANATYYYHFDGLGSVIALTDGSGDAVQLYEYSIFGEVSASDPNHPNRFLFTGREFDVETGLYYYRARYYNPYIGRFLQTDPADQGMNAYTYCANNPVNALDPSGGVFDWCGFRRKGEFLEFWWKDNSDHEQKRQFYSVNEWITWAYKDEENIWSTLLSEGKPWMPQAVGWKMAGWAGAIDDKGTEDQKWWFWRLRAVMMLGVDDMAIEQMEKANWKVTLKYGKGKDLGYFYGGHTVVWDPQRTRIWRGRTGWFHFPPLVSLAHELGHAIDQWNGCFQSPCELAEVSAIVIPENLVRYKLYLYDPTQWNLYPRRGYSGIWPDFGATASNPFPTAAEAWAAYHAHDVKY